MCRTLQRTTSQLGERDDITRLPLSSHNPHNDSLSRPPSSTHDPLPAGPASHAPYQQENGNNPHNTDPTFPMYVPFRVLPLLLFTTDHGIKKPKRPEHSSREERHLNLAHPQHHAVAGDGGTNAHIWCVSDFFSPLLSYAPQRTRRRVQSDTIM